ncbi:hypothetical protein [Leifsonia poae]|uniref:hypothetical protein n=1 Tax=Leifsonia poae TaxID=110933 RepID=UPI001CBD6951|nr:hypothetical protein [Leifsonia poae]
MSHELDETTRAELQREIDENRRSERRLIPAAGIALLVIAVIIVVRVVFFS